MIGGKYIGCVSQWSLKQEDAWTGWMVVTLSLREKTSFVRIVCMLNESIDDLLGHRSRDFHEEKSKKEISISKESGRIPFFSIILPPLSVPTCRRLQVQLHFLWIAGFFLSLKFNV